MHHSTLDGTGRGRRQRPPAGGRARLALAAALALVPASTALAHGGEDHGSAADAANHERYTESLERAKGLRASGVGLLPDLEDLGPAQQVRAIRYCEGLYYVTRATGQETVHWEFNVRVKTDSSEKGPRAGVPVLVPRGSTGDRWFLVFAAPAEISRSIRSSC